MKNRLLSSLLFQLVFYTCFALLLAFSYSIVADSSAGNPFIQDEHCRSTHQNKMMHQSQIFEKYIREEKIPAFWEHERFLKARTWDHTSTEHDNKDNNKQEAEDTLPLPPSEKERKLRGEVDIDYRQMNIEEMRLQHMHSLRVQGIELAKQDGLERLNFVRNLKAMKSESRKGNNITTSLMKQSDYVGREFTQAVKEATREYYKKLQSGDFKSFDDVPSRRDHKFGESLWDFVSWFDAVLILGIVGVFWMRSKMLKERKVTSISE